MKLKTYTVNRWCQIFGFELVDNDGFSIDISKDLISLEMFVFGINMCTIQIINRQRYAVFAALS